MYEFWAKILIKNTFFQIHFNTLILLKNGQNLLYWAKNIETGFLLTSQIIDSEKKLAEKMIKFSILGYKRLKPDSFYEYRKITAERNKTQKSL